MTLFVHRNAGGRCPCGAADAACGPPSDVVPVDLNIEEVAAVSGPLKKYRVRTKNGVDTVLKLSAADAAKLGNGPYEVSDAASTIEPVLPADSGEPSGAAAAMADAGVTVSEGLITGLPAQETEQASGADGQTEGNPPAAAGIPDDGQGEVSPDEDGDIQGAPAEQAPAPKAPARKRASAAANKARGGAANKAAGSGGS